MAVAPSENAAQLLVAEGLSNRRARTAQVSIAIGALVLGVVVYFIDRNPGSVYFIPARFYLSGSTSNVFGIVGNYLPTFVHPFAFVLLTAALLEPTRRQLLIICIVWFAVDSLFELAQIKSIAAWLVTYVPAFNGVPMLENIHNYFLHGTFDVMDLVSIAVGTIAAYFIVKFSDSKHLSEN